MMILGCRKRVLFIAYVFEAKHSISLRHPPLNLVQGVHLKHQNTICLFFNIKENMAGFRCLFAGVNFWRNRASGDIGSVLERPVSKDAAQRISQRIKWTSGARVMINAF